MCLQFIVGLFSDAISIMVFSFLGFIALIYLIGIIISLFVGIVVWFALILMNPMLYGFILALVIGGVLLLLK